MMVGFDIDPRAGRQHYFPTDFPWKSPVSCW